MSAPAVTFEGVCKSYLLYHHITSGIKSFLFNLPKALKAMRAGRMEALRGVSFQAAEGESLGVIGRNGAGKSTLLGLIAGVLKPTAGRVDVTRRVSPLLELGGGFHSELTGRENIMLNGVLMGLSRRQVRQRLDQIVEFSELAEHADQPIRTYSSGMLARLGFSVVAHLEPQLLLIDEVLAVGDIQFRQKCLERMLHFKASGVTIVLVSHALDDVRRLCDRVLWLSGGSVRMLGAPAEVIAAYEAGAVKSATAGGQA